MRQHNKALITLVGAGPGDPDLLTLKAVQAIRSADVILYDSLVNPVILEHNQYARRVFVGKRRGWQKFSQSEICSLLVDLAKFPQHIVRLKGGDPMIFGRAAEELEAAAAHDIEVEIVPGIPSFVGMAAAQQQPLTQRGVSQSLWVVTGTTQTGELSSDLQLAAQSNATVVVLMGMRQLPKIIRLFRKYQQSDYPISIVQNATLPEMRKISGNLSNILAKQAVAQLGSPGLLVFGGVNHFAHQRIAEEAAIATTELA